MGGEASLETVVKNTLPELVSSFDKSGLFILSWFTVNWNRDGLRLASRGRHRVEKITASCREGLSLSCQSRSA